MVQQNIDKAARISLEQLFIPQTKRESEQVTPLVVTFLPDLPHLTHILRDHQCIVDISRHLKQALPKCPLVAYCRPPNPRDLLVREAFKQQRETYTRWTVRVNTHAVKHVPISKRARCLTALQLARNFAWRPPRTVGPATWCTWLSVDNVLFNTSEKRRMHSTSV